MKIKKFEELELQNGNEISVLLDNVEVLYGLYHDLYDVKAQSFSFKEKDKDEPTTIFLVNVEKIFRPDGSEK